MLFHHIIIIDAFNLVGFSQAIYTAAESDGQVEVCVDSLVPIARDTLATIITAPQSANGNTCVIKKKGLFKLQIKPLVMVYFICLCLKKKAV